MSTIRLVHHSKLKLADGVLLSAYKEQTNVMVYIENQQSVPVKIASFSWLDLGTLKVVQGK